MLPNAGATLGGKYALEAVIGRGGMGAVYRAKNLLTGRRVALKWILPSTSDAGEMRTRLLREARAMGRIEHPNVCAVYDVGEDGDAIYLVMELLRGRTLRAMLDERKPRDVEETCSILLSALQGVSAAHQAGVIHRDLKPDNLFVCEDEDGRRGETKVLDFGVSKLVDGSIDEKLTKTGIAVGTPHYMSPEQIVGSRDVDHRADVYALGAILFQCLTGRLPFDAENFSALVVRIAMADPESFTANASADAAPLEPIVRRAIAKKPEQRFADVASLAAALEPFAGGKRFQAPRAQPRSVPPPPAEDRGQTESAPTLPASDPSLPSPSVAVTMFAGPLPTTTPSPRQSVDVALADPATETPARPTASSRALSPAALALTGVVIVLLAIGVALASTREAGSVSQTGAAGSSSTPMPAAPRAQPPSPASTRVEAAPDHDPVVPARSPTDAVGPAAPVVQPPAVPATPRSPEVSETTPARRGARRVAPQTPSLEGEHGREAASPRTGTGRSGTLSTDDF